jgi:hypothetical protein
MCNAMYDVCVVCRPIVGRGSAVPGTMKSKSGTMVIIIEQLKKQVQKKIEVLC